MIGSGDPTPYDLPLAFLLAALGTMLFVGACVGKAWPATVANLARRGTMLLSVISTVTVLILTPVPDGIAGAGRMFLLGPAVAFAVFAYGFWAWRAARL